MAPVLMYNARTLDLLLARAFIFSDKSWVVIRPIRAKMPAKSCWLTTPNAGTHAGVVRCAAGHELLHDGVGVVPDVVLDVAEKWVAKRTCFAVVWTAFFVRG